MAVLVGIFEINDVDTPILDREIVLTLMVEKFKLDNVTVLTFVIDETDTVFIVRLDTVKLDTRRVLP